MIGKILDGDCQNTYWTPWFDVDNPSEGIGDHESFEKIKERFPDQVCLNPMGVQAEVNDSSEITAEEHSIFEISPSSGLICLNQNQTYGQCLNYKIRFCCKGDTAFTVVVVVEGFIKTAKTMALSLVFFISKINVFFHKYQNLKKALIKI